MSKDEKSRNRLKTLVIWLFQGVGLGLCVAGVVGVISFFLLLPGKGDRPFEGMSSSDTSHQPILHQMSPLLAKEKSVGAPQVHFFNAKDQSLALANFRGQVIVVNFWASWCAPCRLEMPSLAKFQARYSPRTVKVIALNLDSDKAKTEAMGIIAVNSPLIFYRDPKYALAFAFSPPVLGLPTSFLIDKQGLIRAHAEGDVDFLSSETISRIEALLRE